MMYFLGFILFFFTPASATCPGGTFGVVTSVYDKASGYRDEAAQFEGLQPTNKVLHTAVIYRGSPTPIPIGVGHHICDGDILRTWVNTTIDILNYDQTEGYKVAPNSRIQVTREDEGWLARLYSGVVSASSFDEVDDVVKIPTRFAVHDSFVARQESAFSVSADAPRCVCVDETPDCGCAVDFSVTVSPINDPNNLDETTRRHSVWVENKRSRVEVEAGKPMRFSDTWRATGQAVPLEGEEAAAALSALEEDVKDLYPTLTQSHHFAPEARQAAIEEGTLELYTSPLGYAMTKTRYEAQGDPPMLIGVHEVTQGLYSTVMHTDPMAAPDCPAEPGVERGPELPVTCVTWWEAIRFANELSVKEGWSEAYKITRGIGGDTAIVQHGANGYRLPTEAQWRRAALGDRGGEYGPTNDPVKVCTFANVAGKETHAPFGWPATLTFMCEDPFPGMAVPGAMPPGSWGLNDMIGNVWEWTQDGNGTHHALGGSWRSSPREAELEFSITLDERVRFADVGFRLIRVPDPVFRRP